MAGQKASELDLQLGARLMALRQSRKVTQRALATHLELSPAQLQKYEAGTNKLAVSTLLRALHYLQTSPAAFLAPFEAEVPAATTVDLATVGRRVLAIVREETYGQVSPG